MQIPAKLQRVFLPKDFEIKDWESLEGYFKELVDREIQTSYDFELWLLNRSELDSVIEENMAWRYIQMTCDTQNEIKQQSFQFFVTEIEPHIQPISNQLDQKMLALEKRFPLQASEEQLMVKRVSANEKLFRAENVPVFTEIQQEQVKYGSTVGALTIEFEGEVMTLQKASNLLQSPIREKRELVYYLIQQKRAEVQDSLNQLFDRLIGLRHRVAQQAGFENYRDYMFEELCRFDYNQKDCFQFHEAIATEVVPLVQAQSLKRTEALGVDVLRPWDLSVDILKREPLKPFQTGKELTQKTIACFQRLHPFLGECIEVMEQMNHLDLDSRIGKAPGGYNYPLYESGVPFIFMNSVGSVRDLVTMVHEGGHAVHSILTKDLSFVAYKNLPSEVAELASMSMELLSMEHWDVFFEDEQELKRAKREHLESIVETLPWVATIDKFQHWLYENPNHTQIERTHAWNEIHSTYSSKHIDWKGLESYKSMIWQKQLHLFEVPFYYIEYGIAQLGAIAVWKNYKENGVKALEQYMDALRLGYTKSIPEIYKTAGIEFNLSASYIKTLMEFLANELNAL